MKSIKPDVAIIGAGIIGVTIAARLVKLGHEVTIIDPAEPGLGASFGNAGHIATEQVFPLANPGVLANIPKMIFDRKGPLVLKPGYMLKFLPWSLRFLWASRPQAFQRGIRATRSLNELSLGCWQDLLSDLGLSSMLHGKGSLEIFQTQKAFAASALWAEQFQAQGVAVEIWPEDKVRQRIPALTGKILGALFFPGTAHTINPHRLVKEIFNKALAGGLQPIQDTITHVKQNAGGKPLLIGKKQQYITDKLVISAGVFSRDILKTLGQKIPLEGERGYHYMLPAPEISVDIPLTFHERKFILTPMEHGIRLAGTVEFGGTSAPATIGRGRMLFDFARQALPGLKQDNAVEWMGFRPTFPDYLPVIDQQDHIIHAYGHNHLGLTQAAITARLVEELMVGKKPSIDLSPFKLGRF